MRILKISFLGILLAGGACQAMAAGAGAGTAPGDTLPKAEELIRKFAARSLGEDQQKRDERYGFTEHRIHDELDKNGNIKDHRDRGYRKVELEGMPYLRWIAKDGKPLSGDDLKQEHDDEQKFLEEAKKKKKDSGDDNVKLDEQFLSNFRFEVIGKETINGRPAYIVTVLPKSRNLSARNSGEKLFTHMQGKVWVDVEDLGMARADLHLTEPGTFYGILGSVRQLDLELSRVFVDNRVWLPESTKFSVEARKLLTPTHIRQSSQYSDYQKLGQ